MTFTNYLLMCCFIIASSSYDFIYKLCERLD